MPWIGPAHKQSDESYYEGVPAKDFVTGDEGMKAFWDVGVGIVKLFIIIPLTFLIRIITDRRRPGRHRG